MTQSPSRNCTNCGAPLAPEQRFCSNCGTFQEVGPAKPTALNSGAAGFYQAETAHAVPPPPPAQGYMSPSASSSYEQTPYAAPSQYQAAPADNFGISSPQPMPMQQAQPLPSYATPMKDSSRGVLRQIGCGVGIVILVIMLTCGGIGYFVFNAIKNAPTSTSSTHTSGSGSSGNSTGSSTTTQPPISTTTLDAVHATVTYASVKMTIIDVKQSKAFLDDTSAPTNGVLRLDFKEEAPSKAGYFLYSDVARLLMPDGTSVQPVNALNSTTTANGTSRTNWLDFPVPTSIKAEQITLLLGTDAEQQIKVPLSGKADLSQYQDKTSAQHKQTMYRGLAWTITNVATSLSNSGKQAQKGMTFVLVTVSVDNPSSTYFTAYYGDYVRLKSGGTISSPTTDSTVPLSFDVGSSGKTGVAIFQIPPGATYTFILLADTTNNVNQASIDFQV